MSTSQTFSLRSNWWVVLATTVGMSLALSVYPPFLFGLFVKPLSQEFGWTRAEISFGITICNYTCLIASPFLGVLIDRVGVRKLVLPSIVGLSVAVSLGYANSGDIRFFYFLHFLIPLLALGTLPHTYTRAVVGWFVENRGLAIGLTVAGVGLGGMIYPQFVQHFMSMHGWRAGYLVIAALIIVICLPVVAAFLREPPKSDASLAGSAAAQSGYTVGEAARRPAFWLLMSIMACMGIVTTGVTVHLASLLSDQGLSVDHAARGVGLLAFTVRH